MQSLKVRLRVSSVGEVHFKSTSVLFTLLAELWEQRRDGVRTACLSSACLAAAPEVAATRSDRCKREDMVPALACSYIFEPSAACYPLHEIYTQCRQHSSTKLPTRFIYPAPRLFHLNGLFMELCRHSSPCRNRWTFPRASSWSCWADVRTPARKH
jgi:hypothetical protein